MSYEPLVKLFADNLETTSLEIAREVIERKLLAYATNEVEFAQLVKTSGKVMMDYMQDGDINKMREMELDLTKLQFDRGMSLEAYQAVGEIIYRKLKELIDVQFADDEALRAKYYRRADAFQALSNVTAITSKIKRGNS